jgi:hypothetical protein
MEETVPEGRFLWFWWPPPKGAAGGDMSSKKTNGNSRAVGSKKANGRSRSEGAASLVVMAARPVGAGGYFFLPTSCAWLWV